MIVLGLIGEEGQKMGSTQIREWYGERNEEVDWKGMKKSFIELMESIGVEQGETVWWEVSELFSRADRHYHTLKHI